jgi:hypothetical protein
MRETFCTEKQLTYLSRISCSGPGAVCDVGSYLGASARALAGQNLFCFDDFVWKPWMGGEAFDLSAMFDARMVGVEHTKVVCDLSNYEWHGGIIKTLFLDTMCNHKMVTQILKSFLPYVRAGGLVLDQDWGWNPVEHFTSWIMYYRLRDRLKVVDKVDDMLVFWVCEMVCERRLVWENTNFDEIKRCVDYFSNYV